MWHKALCNNSSRLQIWIWMLDVTGFVDHYLTLKLYLKSKFYNNNKIFLTSRSKFNFTLIIIFMNPLTFYDRKWLKSATLFCTYHPTNNLLFKFNDRNITKWYEICSNCTMITLERRYWCCSGISLLTLNIFNNFL